MIAISILYEVAIIFLSSIGDQNLRSDIPEEEGL